MSPDPSDQKPVEKYASATVGGLGIAYWLFLNLANCKSEQGMMPNAADEHKMLTLLIFLGGGATVWAATTLAQKIDTKTQPTQAVLRLARRVSVLIAGLSLCLLSLTESSIWQSGWPTGIWYTTLSLLVWLASWLTIRWIAEIMRKKRATTQPTTGLV